MTKKKDSFRVKVSCSIDKCMDVTINAIESIDGLSFKSMDRVRRHIKVAGKFSFKSAGENILIQFKDLGGGLVEIEISSATKLPLLVTYGKNKENIDKIMNAVYENLKEYFIE